ncbi:MAG TPA: hypothetical protein VGM05_14265 [Planctomycetaceae bacterium]|jgi:hypothetical protein
MDVALSVFGAAFAALCVWLTVRVVNRRERWAKWTAAMLLVVLSYPVSVGPVSWISAHGWISVKVSAMLHSFYAPLAYLQTHSELIGRWMFWYEQLWVGD